MPRHTSYDEASSSFSILNVRHATENAGLLDRTAPRQKCHVAFLGLPHRPPPSPQCSHRLASLRGRKGQHLLQVLPITTRLSRTLTALLSQNPPPAPLLRRPRLPSAKLQGRWATALWCPPQSHIYSSRPNGGCTHLRGTISNHCFRNRCQDCLHPLAHPLARSRLLCLLSQPILLLATTPLRVYPLATSLLARTLL